MVFACGHKPMAYPRNPNYIGEIPNLYSHGFLTTVHHINKPNAPNPEDCPKHTHSAKYV